MPWFTGFFKNVIVSCAAIAMASSASSVFVSAGRVGVEHCLEHHGIHTWTSMQQWAAASGPLLLGGEELRLEDWELLWLLHLLPRTAAAGPAAIQRKASLLAHAVEIFVGIIHSARERRGCGPIGGEVMSRIYAG
jgi:hypothetical protein